MPRPWTWWAGVVTLALAAAQAAWSIWAALEPATLADLGEKYAKEAATGDWGTIMTFALSNLFWFAGSLVLIGFALVARRTWMLLVATAVGLISAVLFVVPALEVQAWGPYEVHVALTGAIYVFTLISTCAALIGKVPMARRSLA
jgi:hypothetical protein